MVEAVEPPEQRFRENLLDLVRLCRDIICDARGQGFEGINPALLDVAVSSLALYDPDALITGFITSSYQYWDKMIEKDDKFFQDNMDVIFGGIPLIDMKAVSRLFERSQNGSKVFVTDEDRVALWDFLIPLVKISIRYVHEKRCPCVRNVAGRTQPVYCKDFHNDVVVENFIKKLNIKLDFH